MLVYKVKLNLTGELLVARMVRAAAMINQDSPNTKGIRVQVLSFVFLTSLVCSLMTWRKCDKKQIIFKIKENTNQVNNITANNNE